MNFYKEIDAKFKKYASNFYWGDPLDVRYYLCKQLSNIKNKKILDLGCGPGIIISCINKNNDIYGIDYDENLINIAETINPHAKVSKQDMFSLNFPKEFFDFIILADVLPGHDFKSEKGSKEMINHIKNFLKDDGIILLSTPNGNNAYFSKKNKITIDRIKELLSEFNYELYGYNPFPIQLDRILKFIPFWRDFLEFLMEKKIGFKNSVGLFAIIKKA